MILQHNNHTPKIDPTTFIAATATICGDVVIGKNCRVMYGATIIAEGGSIHIGDNVIVLENAVLRSTERHNLSMGNDVLIGPHCHVVGADIGDQVFIATGAAVFHGAQLGQGSEVRINAVVHLKTVLPENAIVPIGWVAVGDPVQILPPDQHDNIWSIQKDLDFPMTVYGVDRSGPEVMKTIIQTMVKNLDTHKDDKEIQ